MKKALFTSAALIASAFAAAPASAQGIPVIDPSNIAQTVKVVQNGVQQVQQMKAQVEQLTALKNTIGATGPGEIVNILKRSGLDLANNPDGLLSEFRSTVPGIIDGLASSDIGKRLGVSIEDARNARTSVDAGRRFVVNTFYGGNNAGVDEVNQRQAVREAALRDSGAAGFAVAVNTKTRLSENETTIKALTEQMAASTDLRTDVQNNTAVGMAQYQQMIIQTQILAQLLEVQATGNMAMDTTNTQ